LWDGSAEDGTGGRVGQGPVFFVVRVQGRDPREGGGRFGGLGEILVAFEAHGHSDLGFQVRCSRRIRSGSGGRPLDSQNVAPATYGHALAQGDLGGHAKREFDFGACGQGSVGEEENTTRTEVLGESDALHGSTGLAQREREKIREPLSDTAFNPNWRSGHCGVTSFAELPKAQRYFSSRRAIREAPSSANPEEFQAIHKLGLGASWARRGKLRSEISLWKTQPKGAFARGRWAFAI